MKIYLEIRNHGIGEQIFDRWFAYRQHKNANYKSDIQYVSDPNVADRRFLLDYMFRSTDKRDIEKFDLLFCCNGGEYIGVASPHIKNLLRHENTYLICNSLTDTNTISPKLIWHPDAIMICRDCWTRGFYPQLYDNLKNRNLERITDLIFINGRNDTWRHYFIELLKNQKVPMEYHQKINPGLCKTLDCQWESIEDTAFREFVNSLYTNLSERDSIPGENYRSNAVSIGADSKFGTIDPGFFILPEYFTYSCVIFPESSWQNNELCLTEKSLKCFYAGSLPFPIGGANLNKKYESIGFFTAWHLLPEDLKYFDGIENHQERYHAAVQSIRWLSENKKVFSSENFDFLVQKNKENFLMSAVDRASIEKFDRLLFSLLDQKVGTTSES